jgi:hypothetical protein
VRFQQDKIFHSKGLWVKILIYKGLPKAKAPEESLRGFFIFWFYFSEPSGIDRRFFEDYFQA